ncbi:DUF3306 domain-containing protein [Plastorhodobacter daqingensis]|uniref:DUF3306 domain-containing protein n=1 Tax=Plastorhodobacter daqingensis TaxID=1387281 RepID=A0ABW2UJ19_9RHOB
MAEPPFLSRWSQRKRAETAETPAVRPDGTDENGPVEGEAEPDGTSVQPRRDDADPPPELPPLESLGADSDYTQFLRRGVPKALKLAALRRAWSANPAIAAHRPMVEYAWDFNAPGYGRLRAGDDAAAIVAHLLRRRPAREAEPPADLASAPVPEPHPASPESDAPAQAVTSPEADSAADATAAGQDAAPAPDVPAGRRPAGRAVPILPAGPGDRSV